MANDREKVDKITEEAISSIIECCQDSTDFLVGLVREYVGGLSLEERLNAISGDVECQAELTDTDARVLPGLLEKYREHNGCEQVTAEDGQPRFRGNRIVKSLFDLHKEGGTKLTLNDIWVMFGNGLFSRGEMQEFYKLIGYSVNGFHEIFSD